MPVQAFSHLYNHELKDQLMEEYRDYCALLPIGKEPKVLLLWQNRRLMEYYDITPADVRVEVEKLRATDATPSEIKTVEDLLAEGLSTNDIIKSVCRR